jgi:anthranilate synthase/aminodeoxychorismate synthase-like glutamine amidotransferase
MILVIDNYDSFTYNLVQYLGELGQEVRVVRNDEIATAEIAHLGPSHIVVSPGPCTPDQAGISLEVIRTYAGKIPILGVCLGHQSIGQAFGGKVVRARRAMHGKTSLIAHDNRGVFAGLENPFQATRYHSLVVERRSLPACLEISAEVAPSDDARRGPPGSADGAGVEVEVAEIMGLRHKTLAVEGVQFHPESFLTLVGKELLRNFVEQGRRGAGVAAPSAVVAP